MDNLGYSHQMIKYRQEMYEKYDKIHNGHKVYPDTLVTTGGKGEGTCLYYESDIDLMFIVKDVICTNSTEHVDQLVETFKRKQLGYTLFLVVRTKTKPGYAYLKLVELNGKCFTKEIHNSLLPTENGSVYTICNFCYFYGYRRLRN